MYVTTLISFLTIYIMIKKISVLSFTRDFA